MHTFHFSSKSLIKIEESTQKKSLRRYFASWKLPELVTLSLFWTLRYGEKSTRKYWVISLVATPAPPTPPSPMLLPYLSHKFGAKQWQVSPGLDLVFTEEKSGNPLEFIGMNNGALGFWAGREGSQGGSRVRPGDCPGTKGKDRWSFLGLSSPAILRFSTKQLLTASLFKPKEKPQFGTNYSGILLFHPS